MTPEDAMPDINNSATARTGKSSRGIPGVGVLGSAAIIVAMPLWLLACSPIEHPAPRAAADIGPPTIAEPASGPIALAPSITGTATLEAAPRPVSAPALATNTPPPAMRVETAALPEPLPAPTPAVAMPAPPPIAVATAESTATPSPCPPGATAVMSKPDMAGIPVLLCRHLPVPR